MCAASRPDQLEQLADPRAPLLARADAMDDERLLDDRRRPASAGSATNTDPEKRSGDDAARRACPGADNASRSVSLNRTLPDVGSIRRRMHRPVVVLPHPDSPTRLNVSPGAIAKLTSSTARTAPRRPKSPPLPGKSLTSPRTSSSAVMFVRPRRRRRLAGADNSARRARDRRAANGRAVAGRTARIGRRIGAQTRTRAEGRQAPGPCQESPSGLRPGCWPGMQASSPRVYGCAGARNSAATGACSTMRPAYMTATRSAISAMTPRSCVMSSIERLNRAAHVSQQIEDLRLHGDVERRRRLVGNEQRRFGGEGQRDHRPLPQAAAQLVRILAQPALPGPARARPRATRRRVRARPHRAPDHGPRASRGSDTQSCTRD